MCLRENCLKTLRFSVSARSNKNYLFGKNNLTVRFFFHAKPLSFGEPRMNTESHGFFYGKVFFCVLASLRGNLCSTRERKFCFARERFATKISLRSHCLHAESDKCAKRGAMLLFPFFFSCKAAKIKKEPRIATNIRRCFD